jgi:hypothetical protein
LPCMGSRCGWRVLPFSGAPLDCRGRKFNSSANGDCCDQDEWPLAGTIQRWTPRGAKRRSSSSAPVAPIIRNGARPAPCRSHSRRCYKRTVRPPSVRLRASRRRLSQRGPAHLDQSRSFAWPAPGTGVLGTAAPAQYPALRRCICLPLGWCTGRWSLRPPRAGRPRRPDSAPPRRSRAAPRAPGQPQQRPASGQERIADGKVHTLPAGRA